MNIFSQILTDYLQSVGALDNISSYSEAEEFIEIYSYFIAKEEKAIGAITLKDVYESYGRIEPSSLQYLDLKAEASKIPIITEVILNDVTSIGNYAFARSSLNVSLPKSVLSISGTAFYN